MFNMNAAKLHTKTAYKPGHRCHRKGVESVTFEHSKKIQKRPFLEKDLEQFILTMIQILEFGNTASILLRAAVIGHIGRVHIG